MSEEKYDPTIILPLKVLLGYIIMILLGLALFPNAMNSEYGYKEPQTFAGYLTSFVPVLAFIFMGHGILEIILGIGSFIYKIIFKNRVQDSSVKEKEN